MKNLIVIILLTVAAIYAPLAQDHEIIETTFKVFGNCDQCKARIEKTVKIHEVKYAKWNKSTKMLKVAFENSITADSLQRRLAEVGHDTEKYKAKDETYNALPKCCLYRDNSKTH
ncbi:MAG: ATPase [Ignavibacteriaceae bacterium]|nr:ATPase [Ignavibacteriaceae bacterium]